jgi:transcriptional regulator with XRE-family HTH domain
MESEASLRAGFGRVLAEVRRQAGLSQQTLALECGLDRTYISLLERRLRQPSLGTLFSLAKALHTRPSMLVASVEAKLTGRIDEEPSN